MAQPLLMRPDEIICVKEAAHRAGRDPKTIRDWCRTYGIGRQPAGGGPFQVSLPALEMLLVPDFEALELLRQGHRTAPEVLHYLNFLGLAA